MASRTWWPGWSTAPGPDHPVWLHFVAIVLAGCVPSKVPLGTSVAHAQADEDGANADQADSDSDGIGDAGDVAEPTCVDGVQNGDETDVDCGGTTCPGCGTSQACGTGGDCVSGVCAAGVCEVGGCADPSPARYIAGQTHSPITCSVAQRLLAVKAINTGLADNVFAKVGDSNTAGSNYMSCFATETYDLNSTGHDSMQSAVTHFLSADLGGVTPFERVSLAAQGSETASWAIAGDPTPIQAEIDAISPRYSVVMFGTNDLWHGGDDSNIPAKYEWYGDQMLQLIDVQLGQGVIPVLSSIPPHNGMPTWFHDLVPALNALVMSFAQSRQIPFVDLYGELIHLTDCGLGIDGVHLNRFDYDQICNFSTAGLDYGYNTRNLITLEALDRVWQVVRDTTPRESWDARGAAALVGTGTSSDPYVMDQMPFMAAANSVSGTNNLQTYTGCPSAKDGNGNEFVYRFDTSEAINVRAVVVDQGSTDVDLYLLASDGTCVAAADTMIDASLAAGTHLFVIDTVANTPEGHGEFHFVLLDKA